MKRLRRGEVAAEDGPTQPIFQGLYDAGLKLRRPWLIVLPCGGGGGVEAEAEEEAEAVP